MNADHVEVAPAWQDLYVLMPSKITAGDRAGTAGVPACPLAQPRSGAKLFAHGTRGIDAIQLDTFDAGRRGRLRSQDDLTDRQ